MKNEVYVYIKCEIFIYVFVCVFIFDIYNEVVYLCIFLSIVYCGKYVC